MSVKIDNKQIDVNNPVYFIADIASNHGGDLSKAKELIYACSESGVDAVKMQNFSAETIVSDHGFKNLENVKTHQSGWKTSVFDSYKAASIPFEWTLELKELTEKLNMSYFTSPYSLELVKAVEPYVSAFKLGSGDITWHEEIELMASYDKPLIIATGASSLDEVKMAMAVALKKTDNILLLQCNTNYTARYGEPEAVTRERFSNLNLKVLDTYNKLWPGIPVGLSDHTHGSLSVLASVGLFDCCAVEKHFTFDSTIEGQDHAFSMMPKEWKQMVDETRALKADLKPGLSFEERFAITAQHVDNKEYLQLSVGTGIKEVEDNEKNTVIVQRRAVRATRKLQAGDVLTEADLTVLRPCPKDALPPYELPSLIGKTLNADIEQGEYIKSSAIN
ncbi:N-acetylneuraminate synthase family protein [Mucilaginibacter lutimaris]|uniref:N-acetylneuraminate synthase family protein n=1 Tax=Mucilaginibacter lutimaris TaxID=931629 RepID=A0ABW2ZBX2_9SPHI